MIMTVLNDLFRDLHIFSSSEFGTVEADDSHFQTSSVFPQKKIPYGLETVKIKAAAAHRWMATALALFRNAGTGDHSSRSVSCIDEAYKVTQGMLRLSVEIVERLTVHKERWEELLLRAWVTTNRLGDVLFTRHGMSYRAAHGVVARLVKNSLVRGVEGADVTVEMLHVAAAEMGARRIDIGQAELTASLDHGEFVRSCRSFGSAGSEKVERLLGGPKKRHEEDRQWIDA